MLSKALLGAASGTPTDPYFKNVTMLLHGDGTNGAQNNTFVDSSPNNFAITRNGNTTQGTFSPFSKESGKWGVAFDGSGDYLTAPSNSAFAYGTGDFTWELWVYRTSATYSYFIDHGTIGGQIEVSSSNRLSYYNPTSGTGSPLYNVEVNFPVNVWVHVAAARSGGITRLFVNGVLVASGADSHNYNAQVVTVGAMGGGSSANLTGYISNLRIVKGTALYTANFTPSTTPLTAVSGTSLLTCQSNRFIDNSANNFTLTPNGNVAVTPFSPFANSAAYNPAVNGGSGYFDGSGDYLSVPSSSAFDLGSSNFTIEFWLRTANLSTWQTLLDRRTGTNATGFVVLMNLSTGKLGFYASGVGWPVFTSNTDIPASSWVHVAIVRNGNSFKMYQGGIEVASATSSAAIIDVAQPLLIGHGLDANSGLNGYISNLRIIRGTAIYTANFTPPTAPLTAVTNTSLLLNFTNAGIYDNTGLNNLETVGNAQISTSVKKYGKGAMYFDGSGDYLSAPSNTAFVFGTGDFTVECWVNLNSVSGRYHFFGNFNAVSSIPSGWVLQWQSDLGGWNLQLGFDRVITYSTPPSIGEWNHIAVSRAGSSLKMFLNGVQVASVTNTTDITGAGNNLTVGVSRYEGGFLQYMNGYIDDLRITKGVARYTANFTPPARAFPDK